MKSVLIKRSSFFGLMALTLALLLLTSGDAGEGDVRGRQRVHRRGGPRCARRCPGRCRESHIVSGPKTGYYFSFILLFFFN